MCGRWSTAPETATLSPIGGCIASKDRQRARLNGIELASLPEDFRRVEHFKTYAPTANMVVVRTLFAYAAIEGLHIQQFDIKAAFLYGDLEETVYMHQPAGFAKGDKVCLLKRSLYALKQAPRQWCRKFSEFLLETSLVISSEDRCVFYKLDPFLALVIYVDDGILFARQPKDADELIDKLSKRFELHNMALSTFLGFQVERPHKHQIILHQKCYINKILTKFAQDDTKTERSPISPKGMCEDETPLDSSIPYRNTIGSLLYASLTTRIDIAFPVALASRYLSAPTNKILFLVNRITRYLRGEHDRGISYQPSKNEGLIAYCDSDFANDEEGRLSLIHI